MTDLDRLLAAGITYRQIDVWVRNGWLRPVAKGGTGNRREWPAREIRIALLMKRLTDAGITAARAAGIARKAEAAQAEFPSMPVTVDLGNGLRLSIVPTVQEEAA